MVPLRKDVDAHIIPDLQLCLGPILGYDGSVYAPILAYTDGCSYSTDENEILPFFSPQITRG